jgi:hypothetical protein
MMSPTARGPGIMISECLTGVQQMYYMKPVEMDVAWIRAEHQP